MLSENNEAIQSKIHLILKNSRNSVRTIKRERARENKDTTDFYTGSPNSRATSSPSHTVRISLK